MAVDRMPKPTRQEQSLDAALEQSFPASDPVSAANPSTGTVTTEEVSPSEANLDARIAARAEKIWRQTGSPAAGPSTFLDEARTLIAIEDDPKAGTLPNPAAHRDNIGPEGEPIEPTMEVENLGEFPSLTDQGDQVYPPRRPGRR